MSKIQCRLTVYFENPFWVGVYERREENRLEVSRMVFGAEPKDYQVYAFLLDHWSGMRFSPPVVDQKMVREKTNPKRLQREIHRQLDSAGVGTKAQQAIKLQQEEGREARKKESRVQREEERQMRFRRKQEKRREKHKGH